MAPQKIKITKNEIPNAILSDDVYDICCQYFTNGRLTSIYDPHKYFCNQSNKFHTTLRNINEELKKIMIMSTVIFFQQLINMLKTSNNTIEHSSSNQPTLVNSCEKGSSKDSTAANEEISNSTIEHSSNPVVDNSSSQSQHQVINIITDDNNRSDNWIKNIFKNNWRFIAIIFALTIICLFTIRVINNNN
ncbi:hypothetical protein C2G38_2226677 [Gigaspora rosea]|uniref:Uncharacterized protein n=1 Tax=Gigaspora rosea TaxID=44941 RepID=A0A397U6X8_9GLOM|nr:hypothetical protein C2G38_2226677 [Gigaspora rosea]